MGILAWIVVGLVAGVLASLVMGGTGYGIIGDIIIGIVGAFIGGWLFGALGVSSPWAGWVARSSSPSLARSCCSSSCG